MEYPEIDDPDGSLPSPGSGPAQDSPSNPTCAWECWGNTTFNTYSTGLSQALLGFYSQINKAGADTTQGALKVSLFITQISRNRPMKVNEHSKDITNL